MSTCELKADAVRWDTFDNKIYFNLGQGSFEGRLILRKNADGKIDMYLDKEEPVTGREPHPATAVDKLRLALYPQG